LLLEARKVSQANAVLQKLVELQPENPHAEHSLAVSYFLLGGIDEGIRHCRRALKLKPEYPLALYNLAQAHMQQGQYERARRYVAKAITMDPADGQIRELAGKLGVVNFWTTLKNRLPRLPRLVPRRRRRDAK
jgi:Flp pilus assembly protein TadD